jgi:hypothetical protein
VLLVFLVASYLLFVSPATDGRPAAADAVVVLGSFDGRLDRGLELVERATAPVLVLSQGGDLHPVCESRPAYEVICRTPSPFTTRGEARMVRDLADERGWESIVVVTSAHHVTRARLLFERCFDGRVQMTAATAEHPLVERPAKVLHEWLGLGQALTVARGC